LKDKTISLNQLTMNDILIKKIQSGIFGIKLGTKEPKEIASLLNRLKPINIAMYEELLAQYKLVIK